MKVQIQGTMYELEIDENNNLGAVLYDSDGNEIDLATLLSDIASLEGKDFALDSNIDAVRTLIGEVQVAPTENTLLERVKNIEDNMETLKDALTVNNDAGVQVYGSIVVNTVAVSAVELRDLTRYFSSAIDLTGCKELRIFVTSTLDDEVRIGLTRAGRGQLGFVDSGDVLRNLDTGYANYRIFWIPAYANGMPQNMPLWKFQLTDGTGTNAVTPKSEKIYSDFTFSDLRIIYDAPVAPTSGSLTVTVIGGA
jgi:hypothetical protein